MVGRLDFAKSIADAVGSCQVLLAVLGDRWLDSTDRKGRRELDDPDDLVRLELKAALERDVRVIPLLVDGVSMPSDEELPPSLAPLAPFASACDRQSRGVGSGPLHWRLLTGRGVVA